MKKKIGLLLSAVLVINALTPFAIVWGSSLSDLSRIAAVPPSSPAFEDENYDGNYSIRRNDILRESSRQVYSDPSEKPAWLEGPSFYPEPTLESIIEKYRRSDFAGCMQEATAYVRKYPNDTLGFYYLAMSYTKVDDKDNAIKAYERVIELNDNPMIVKYATNGRNCILGNGSERCFQNVNVPEYLRPYENLANMDLTPIDPQTLVDRNLNLLKLQLNQAIAAEAKDEKGGENKGELTLPFGQQDDALDAFINAPYGNGFSPELDKQYKQLQLRKIQKTINQGDGSDANKKQNFEIIKKFDKQKSDSETIKLAYDNSDFDFEKLKNDPEFVRQQQEIDELNMMFGNNSSSDDNGISELIPYMSEDKRNLSPEVIQTMMMKSVMSNFTL